MRTLTALTRSLLVVGVVGLAACGGSSDGDEGLIQFTPLDCGRTSCTFDDSIAVGGRVALHILGAEGVSTIGLDVRPADSSVLSVDGIPDVGGRPTWELTAIAPGDVALEVFRPGETPDGDEVIDTLTISLTAVSRLGLQSFIGNAVGPAAGGADFDESWTVNADAPVSFRVTPFDDADAPAMGLFDYTVALDPELESGLIDTNTTEGRLYVRPPAGTWNAEWSDGAATLRAQIIAQ